MDNLDLSEKAPIIRYTIPVDKNPPEIDGFFNRDYPSVDISNVDFVKWIDKVANALVAFGIKKGDFIVICHSNTPEIMYMDYALNKIGAIPSYVYPNIIADEMKHYIKEVKAKYIFMLDETSIRNMVLEAAKDFDVKIIASSAVESFPTVFKTVANLKTGYKKSRDKKITYWSDFIKGGKSTTAKENEYKPNDLCSLTHTSGTTSLPKAVMESQENINSVVLNLYLDNVGYNKNDVVLTTIPQFVEYGKTMSHTYFCNNTCLVFIPEMDPKNYYDMVTKFKPAYSSATPSHAREMMKRDTDLSFSKQYFFGGDGFDDVEEIIADYFERNNSTPNAVQGYGSTEISATGLINTNKNRKFGSLGTMSGNTIVKVFEPDTEIELTANEIGELAVTGPTVTLGYYNDPEETAKVFRKHSDGKIWVHMGDLARIDEDGFVFYEGRIKNVIARKSFKFSPTEIVDVVMQHEKVSECVVVAKFSEEEGQTPSAHIVLKDYSNTEQTLAEIKKLVDNNVQEFHRPTDYKIRQSIVRTRNNKNNVIALRIEDNATIHPLVSSAEIELVTDGIFDYRLTLKTVEQVNEAQKQEIIEYITDILKKEKMARNKINYIFA